MVKISENLGDSRNNIKRIMKGSAISIVITLVLLLIFSIVLSYTSIGETTIPTVTIIITVISILIGSSMSLLKVKKNGIINGALIGLIYIASLYLISSTIKGDFSFNLYSTIMIIGSVLAGALGGIIGVNRK